MEKKIIRFNGRKYLIDNHFRAVLKALEIARDDIYTGIEKLDLMLYILILKGRYKREDISFKNSLLKVILNDLLGNKQVDESGQRVFDFKQDEELIFSSFLFDYNINLDEKDLTWKQYSTLLSNLSSECKLFKVIGYRQMKIPAITKDNREQVESIIKLKNMYRLEISEEERNRRFANSLKKAVGIK